MSEVRADEAKAQRRGYKLAAARRVLENPDLTYAELLDWKRRAIIWFRGQVNREGRQSCYICGRYRAITQAHHVVPLSELIDFFLEFGDRMPEIPTRTVWLCPTHHVIMHKHKWMTLELFAELTPSETAKLDEIERMEDLTTYVLPE